MTDRALDALAAELGVLTRWTDADGTRRRVPADVQRALAEGLGFPAATPAQIADSRSRLAQRLARPAPLSTVVAGVPTVLDGVAPGAAFRIELENGERIDGRLPHDAPLLPAVEAIGYHHLEAGGLRRVLAVAPPRCHAPPARHAGARPWGLAVQLPSLRRRGDGGIGDFAALAELAPSAAAAGAAALAISPVHAMFAGRPDWCSPYAPSSRRFLNVLFADPGGAAADDAASASSNALIDWAGDGAAKLAALRRFHDSAEGRALAASAAFSAFCRDGGDALRRHAQFEAMRSGHAPWTSGVAAGETGFHLFAQWLAARGLARAQAAAREAGMPIGLIADLAVGSDPSGSDAWACRERYLGDLTIGAPPDAFTRDGQSWGLTTYTPLALRENGYGDFIALLRAAMRHAGGVRIDHAMSLLRLWLVPRGASARDGAYLSYPLRDLMRLLALESVRHRCLVIGEDLGVVPAGFRRTLRGAGVLGTDVLWFQRGEDFTPPRRWRRDAVAMTTTHDLPTLAGWWRGLDIAARRRVGASTERAAARAQATRRRERARLVAAIRAAGIETPSADDGGTGAFVEAAIGFVGTSRAALVLLPLEDALARPNQVNLPGIARGYPNWSQRLPGSASQLLDAAPVRRRLRALANARTAR